MKKKYILSLFLLAGWGSLTAAPITSVNVVFNGTGKEFKANVTTNTTGSGQIWIQAFPSPDAGQVINLEVLKNGEVKPNAISPTSLVTESGRVTYGFPDSTPLPIKFYLADTGLTLRATVAGSTVAKESATFSVIPGSATRLLLLAPGMTHLAGTNPDIGNGKSGNPLVQTPNQTFPLTVILTDNSFNRVSENHAVSFVSGDLIDLPASDSLENGIRNFNCTIRASQTNRVITVRDLADPAILAGSVEVNTSGPPDEEVFPYPNPFNPLTGTIIFRFQLRDAGSGLFLKVKDQFGQGVWEKEMTTGAGITDVVWDGRNENGSTVAAGTYYVLLETGGSVKSKKRFAVIK